jgi:hypothetical protein
MAQTFTERVTALAGAPSSAANLNTWLTNEARKIVDLLPFTEADQHKVSVQIDPTGTVLSNYRFISASRLGYPARVMPYAEYGRMNDPASFLYPGDKDPVIYFNDYTAYGLPVHDTDFTAQCVQYPVVVGSDVAMSSLPPKYEELIVLGAAQEVANANLQAQQAVLAAQLTRLAAQKTALDALPASVSMPDVNARLTLMLGYITSEEDFEKATAMGQQIQTDLTQYTQALTGARLKADIITNGMALLQTEIATIRSTIELLSGQLTLLRGRYSELYAIYFGKGAQNAAG